MMTSLPRPLQIGLPLAILSLFLLIFLGIPHLDIFAQGDTDPPHVVSFDFEPKTINTALSPQTITFTVHLTDDLSGVVDGGMFGPTHARFFSPSGIQLADVTFFPSRDLIWGDDLNGIYASAMQLPQYCETGMWELEYFHLFDKVGNHRYLNHGDIISMGFPVEFLVEDDVYRTYLPAVMREYHYATWGD